MRAFQVFPFPRQEWYLLRYNINYRQLNINSFFARFAFKHHYRDYSKFIVEENILSYLMEEQKSNLPQFYNNSLSNKKSHFSTMSFHKNVLSSSGIDQLF